MDKENLIHKIIEAAIAVKRELGAGFLEAVYQNALGVELELLNIPFEKEKWIEVLYKNRQIGKYKADFIVDGRIILELKVAESISKNHEYQLVNYLTAANIDDGLLINFGETPINIKRKYRIYKRGERSF